MLQILKLMEVVIKLFPWLISYRFAISVFNKSGPGNCMDMTLLRDPRLQAKLGSLGRRENISILLLIKLHDISVKSSGNELGRKEDVSKVAQFELKSFHCYLLV